MFHSDTPGSHLQLQHCWNHNNHVGRWLTNFRATWDPKCDYRFVCGSMTYPRKVNNSLHCEIMCIYCNFRLNFFPFVIMSGPDLTWLINSKPQFAPLSTSIPAETYLLEGTAVAECLYGNDLRYTHFTLDTKDCLFMIDWNY